MTFTTIEDPSHAELLMHPLRRRILAEAAEPISASGIAGRLGVPRQRVNYHVKELADAEFLEPAGEVRKRNMIEKLYRASADSYAIGPDVLGDLAPSPEEMRDSLSAGTLLALAVRTQSELGQSAQQARDVGKRLATLSIDTELRFTSSKQQAEFSEALTQAVADIVSKHSEPATSSRGHHYRLVAGAYPLPKPSQSTPR